MKTTAVALVAGGWAPGGVVERLVAAIGVIEVERYYATLPKMMAKPTTATITTFEISLLSPNT